MIELLIINKILKEQSLNFISKFGIDKDWFKVYKAEIDFILDYYSKYNHVPSQLTFLSTFQQFEIIDVTDSDDFLFYKLKEGLLYADLVPLLQGIAQGVKDDSIVAIQELKERVNDLQKKYQVKVGTGSDICQTAEQRFKDYDIRTQQEGLLGITTGIHELDNWLHGWLPEDLLVLVARTNKGKSWMLLFFLVQAWMSGKKVLMYSGEMSQNVVGYRFDTLYQHFSNKGLMNGDKSEYTKYQKYTKELSKKEGFIVVTPQDFGGLQPTVGQLEELMLYHNADILGVDQISLMNDQRKGDSKTVQYGNISADLFILSEKLQKPVLALAQAGREAERVKSKGLPEGEIETPEIHHIEYSDMIGQNATRVISMNTNAEGILKLSVIKNRYGQNNVSCQLNWNIDRGYIKPLFSGTREQLEQVTEEYGF